MTTKRRREAVAERLTMDAPAPRQTPEELAAEIAATEAHLQDLYRERDFVPFPTMLFKEVPQAGPQSVVTPPVVPVVESVTVYSEAGVAAAEAEGYTEDYESIVDPEPPPPDPLITRASEPYRSGD